MEGLPHAGQLQGLSNIQIPCEETNLSSSYCQGPETLGGWAGRSGDHAAHHGTRPPIGSRESPRSRRLLEIKHRAGALPGAAGETGAALRLRK